VTSLRADCGSCRALCCVAPAFVRSADFPITKPAGVPCPNLAGTVCSVHTRLRPLGFAGCVAYDCFGAGQVISSLPLSPAEMYVALPVLRQLHELLYYLGEASARAPSPALTEAHARVAALASRPDVLSVDAAAERAQVAPLLVAASATIRTTARPGSADLAGRDLAGTDLGGRDLASATLRGAVLIGASLRGAALVGADLLGADLRDADLSGADLTDALFLTRTQVGGALGSAATRLPPALDRPPHWAQSPRAHCCEQ
jgi:Pentapeptide repeats (8 copies)